MIGIIVLFNQIFPGELAKLFVDIVASFNTSNAIFGIMSLLCFLIGVITMIVVLSYSYGGTAQARDLKHLIELSLARREYHDGKRHYGDTDKEDILRDSYLTDI